MTKFALLLCVVPAAAFAVTPVNGGPVSGGSNVTINADPGDQTDPHVSGDLAAYTDIATSQIRYYRFSAAADAAIPSDASVIDILSDVSGNLVAFSRIMADRNAIMVFDTTTATVTEVAATAGSNRLGAALGNQTVAFIDLAAGGGDVYAFDLATSTLSAVSTSALAEQNPNVSPDGNAIVWEQCPSSLTNCNVFKATKSGTAWTAAAVADTGDPEQNPDTDGTTIAYDADHGSATGRDIYLVPLAGGTTTQLEISGDQENPSISSGIVGFESRATSTSASDLYIYVTATNTVYQVTNTPDVDEMLNDISVLPSGQIRMVWAANDGAGGEQNIYGMTFDAPVVTPPPPVCLNRSVTLDAKSGSGCSGGSTDAHQTFSTPYSYAVPSSIPVVAGNAHNREATLSWTTSCGQHQSCAYQGSSGGSTFVLQGCSPGVHAGTVVVVTDLRLHVEDEGGHGHSNSTVEAKVTLTEACATAPVCTQPPPHGGNCPHHRHHHGEWWFCDHHHHCGDGHHHCHQGHDGHDGHDGDCDHDHDGHGGH